MMQGFCNTGARSQNMDDRNFELSQEPLWTAPQAAYDWLSFNSGSSEYRSFLLCGLYCAMNSFLPLLFSYYSLTIGASGHALVLLMLGGLTLAGYGLIWLARWHSHAKYFTTAMMAVLCLYLFHNGGLLNSGPLYYFVFPPVAISLHGRLRGFLWVILLLVLTLLLRQGFFDFDVGRYDNVFVARLVVISLFIALLTCIPEYYRAQAERKLLLSLNDIESMVLVDLDTGLANRRLLDKLLQMEFSRNQRYGPACCVMFIEPDPLRGSMPGIANTVDRRLLLAQTADILRSSLRVPDIAGRWDKQCFLVVLPEASLESAGLLAGRLLERIRALGTSIARYPVTTTASIGIAALDKGPARNVLERAANNLLAAQQQHGDCCVAD